MPRFRVASVFKTQYQFSASKLVLLKAWVFLRYSLLYHFHQCACDLEQVTIELSRPSKPKPNFAQSTFFN